MPICTLRPLVLARREINTLILFGFSLYLTMCVCMHVFMCIYIHTNTHIYAYMCVYIYKLITHTHTILIYLYIYIFIHVFNKQNTHNFNHTEINPIQHWQRVNHNVTANAITKPNCCPCIINKPDHSKKSREFWKFSLMHGEKEYKKGKKSSRERERKVNEKKKWVNSVVCECNVN